MLKGFYLTIMAGPVIPVPVPKEVLDSLVSVSVVTTAGTSPSGFEMVFTLSNQSPLQTIFLLAGASPVPLMRVVLILTMNGQPNVLIDGVMTNHEVKPGADAGHSLLTIKGKDLTAVMDWIDFSGLPYPAMPPEARIALILLKYAVLGILPLVIPSILLDVPIPTQRIPVQKETDYSYIKQLAADTGYVFYLDPGPAPGTSVAYWGPEIKVGAPQPALNINMDAFTNVEALSFTFDTEQKTLPVLFIQEPITKIPLPIPIPDINPLSPPLGLIPLLSLKIEPITGISQLTPIQALLLGIAKASKSSDAVVGTGTLDVLRYGQPLQARKLVGVRGVGMAFDGLYYVKSVTHNITRGEYKQNFTLTRNGLISTVPNVPS